MKKHVVWLLLLFFLSVVFSVRKSYFDLTFGDKASLSGDATAEIDAPNLVDKLESFSLGITHDGDIGLLLPWVRQSIRIEYVDGEIDYKNLDQVKISDVIQKRYNLPFSGKLMYQDESVRRELTLTGKKQIRRVGLDLANASELNLYSTDDKSIFSFWIRPKFHHDGYLAVNGQQAGLTFNQRVQMVYYLKIIMAIICYSLFWGELIIVLLKALAKLFLTKVIIPANFGWFDQKAVLVLLCLVGGMFIFVVGKKVLEWVPHSQDEVVYLFQSKIFSRGKLYANSLAENGRKFFDHEFVINDGKWYGKYPPGTSLLLSVGNLLGKPELVNPFLSVVNLWLIMLIAGILAGSLWAKITIWWLMVSSPFFLLISASYLSHPAGLLMTLVAVYSYLRIEKCPERYFFWISFATSIGLLLLIRPVNALGVVLGLGLWLLALRGWWSRKLAVVGILIVFVLLNLCYNKILTDNMFLLPVNRYSPFDKIGWGERGVEWGSKFGLNESLSNLSVNLYSLVSIGFGFPAVALLGLMPLGIFMGDNKLIRLKLLLFLLTQVIIYFFYFHEGTFMGPRYWYEVFWIIPVIAMLGLDTLATKLKVPPMVWCVLLATGGSLSVIRTLKILPSFRNYNAMSRVQVHLPEKRSIIFVNSANMWQSYGQYFYQLDPFFGDKYIWARDTAIHNVWGSKIVDNLELKKYFPNRDFYRMDGADLVKID